MSWPHLPAPPPDDPAAQGEAALIDAGWEIYLRARDDGLARRLEVTDDLGDALDTYGAIHAGTIHPAAYWDDLEHDPQPYDTGLRRAAGDVLERLAGLIGQAPALAEDRP